MSLLWRRFVAAVLRRGISKNPPQAGATGGGDIEMDPIEHATGIEKRELLALAEGRDPYYSHIIKRGAGTKEVPTLIPAVFERRIIGCLCEGGRPPKYMFLERGIPKRCACGYWFKLKEVKPL